MALVIGVTGSIATGKSSLCRYVAERYGAVHIDGDRVAHAMYAPDREGFGRIVAEFGESVIGADGTIDRRVLGGMVFGNAERMKALTTAIGDIKGEVNGIVEGYRKTLAADAIVIMEVVLLIDSDYAWMCDQNWLVAAEDEIATPRLMGRNGLTEAEARQRLASARPWQERAPAVDRIFMNAGTVEDLQAEVDIAIAETLDRFRAGTLDETRYLQWRHEQQSSGGST